MHNPVTGSESSYAILWRLGCCNSMWACSKVLTLCSSHLMKSCTSCSVRCELDTTDMGQARVSPPFWMLSTLWVTPLPKG